MDRFFGHEIPASPPAAGKAIALHDTSRLCASARTKYINCENKLDPSLRYK